MSCSARWRATFFSGEVLVLLALGGLLLGLGGTILNDQSQKVGTGYKFRAFGSYLFIRVIVNVPVRTPLILILVVVILILVVLILKLIRVDVLTQLLELQSLTGEPVDGTGNQLLLDILTQLVVQLQALLNVASNGLVIIDRWLRGGEEVEEGLGGHADLDNAGLLGVCGKSGEVRIKSLDLRSLRGAGNAGKGVCL